MRAVLVAILIAGLSQLNNLTQQMPATAGETLTGSRIVLAEALKGHSTVLVAAFSRQAGDGCETWWKALHADPTMTGVLVYQAAMLEKAPGFVRGLIRSGMRKGLSPAQQESFVVLTQDEKLWRNYLRVDDDRDPYVLLLDPAGRILWRGHGSPDQLEALLRAARR